jgi:hypothetical protein
LPEHILDADQLADGIAALAAGAGRRSAHDAAH